MRETFHDVLPLTDDESTSAVIDYRNFAGGRVINSSGAQVVITWHESPDKNGVPVLCGDVGQTTIDDGETAEIPPELAGVNYLVPVAGGNTHVSVVLKS